MWSNHQNNCQIIENKANFYKIPSISFYLVSERTDEDSGWRIQPITVSTHPPPAGSSRARTRVNPDFGVTTSSARRWRPNNRNGLLLGYVINTHSLLSHQQYFAHNNRTLGNLRCQFRAIKAVFLNQCCVAKVENHCKKGSFTYPVYTCVFRRKLRLQINCFVL